MRRQATKANLAVELDVERQKIRKEREGIRSRLVELETALIRCGKENADLRDALKLIVKYADDDNCNCEMLREVGCLAKAALLIVK